MATKEESRASGIVVNTCGWIEKEGYDLLLDTIRAFKADVVLVIDNERLHTDLKDKEFIASKIEFVKLKKSGGVLVSGFVCSFDLCFCFLGSCFSFFQKKKKKTNPLNHDEQHQSRDRESRSLARQQSIREYFYGARGELHPHHLVILSSVVRTCTVGGEHQAPSTALPVGAERVLDVTEVNQVEPSGEMKHALGAISFSDDISNALGYNLCGFVQITDVQNDRVHLLSPCPGRLPSTVLLVSDISCLDAPE